MKKRKNKKIERYFQKDYAQWTKVVQNRKSIVWERNFLAQKIIKNLKNRHLVDLGCGDGTFLQKCLLTTSKTGLDFSLKLLKIAKNRNPNAKFLPIDFNRLAKNKIKLPKKLKYVVTALGLIHYLKKPNNFLRYLIKWFPHNTYFLISFRNRNYNINPASKYNKSKATLKIQREIAQENILLQKKIDKKRNVKNLLHYIQSTKVQRKYKISPPYVGFTDKAWNPFGFSIWRQFRPLEALLLFLKNGISPKSLFFIADKTSSHSNLMKIKPENSTVFLVLGQKK